MNKEEFIKIPKYRRNYEYISDVYLNDMIDCVNIITKNDITNTTKRYSISFQVILNLIKGAK